MQQAALSYDHGFLLDRNPNIGWIAFQGFSKKARGRNPDHREWMAFDDQRGPDDGRIGAISDLPGAMADHQRWWSARPVILRSQHPSVERSDAQSGEIMAVHELRTQWTCRTFLALVPYAHPATPGLKCGNLLKF